MTRIASSSPVMWQHICFANKKSLLALLDAYTEELGAVRELIAQEDREGLLAFFRGAKDYRDSLQLPAKSILPTVHEFYCDIPDESGGIAAVASILAAHGLNIKNIGIVHNREFEEGVLRIEMYDRPSMEAATALLRDTYIIHSRNA